MRIALIADVFPPLRSSGAVQLRDLSLELVRQRHQVTVMIPGIDQKRACVEDWLQGVEVLRLSSPRTKDVGLFRRALAEFWMPFSMLRSLRQSKHADTHWDGIVWYSPTIFLGPMAKSLQQKNHCASYLIIRDIFPEWAVDMGLLKRGLAYWFFKVVERYQYAVAHTIGVQTPANLPYFENWQRANRSPKSRKVEVLQNWLADAPIGPCTIQVEGTRVAGRTLFVYAGNMGVAQGMDILLDLAERLLSREDMGFIFVGRGTDAVRIRQDAKMRGLTNTVFFNEIAPEEIPGLYAQCHVGLVALDPRHKTHNIPGKFLTYMQSGLPVLASINAGNDLAELIQVEALGVACTSNSVDELARKALDLVQQIRSDSGFSGRCKALSARLFSAEAAVRQITKALQST